MHSVCAWIRSRMGGLSLPLVLALGFGPGQVHICLSGVCDVLGSFRPTPVDPAAESAPSCCSHRMPSPPADVPMDLAQGCDCCVQLQLSPACFRVPDAAKAPAAQLVAGMIIPSTRIPALDQAPRLASRHGPEPPPPAFAQTSQHKILRI